MATPVRCYPITPMTGTFIGEPDRTLWPKVELVDDPARATLYVASYWPAFPDTWHRLPVLPLVVWSSEQRAVLSTDLSAPAKAPYSSVEIFSGRNGTVLDNPFWWAGIGYRHGCPESQPRTRLLAATADFEPDAPPSRRFMQETARLALEAGEADIVGKGWPSDRVLPGHGLPDSTCWNIADAKVRDLREAVSRARFALCVEPDARPWVVGWAPWVALAAGTLPVFWFRDTLIETAFPPTSIVDASAHASPAALLAFLRAMPEAERQERLALCRKVLERVRKLVRDRSPNWMRREAVQRGWFALAARAGTPAAAAPAAPPGPWYSQFGEDAFYPWVLPAGFKGRFLDIGAYDGKELSNTYKLAEQGWEGLMVEPDSQTGARLARNIAGFGGRVKAARFAVGNANGTLEFHSSGTPFSTSDDTFKARFLDRQQIATRTERVEQLDVPTLLARHPGPWHVVSIDTEGMTAEIFEAMPFDRMGTRLVIVEWVDQDLARIRRAARIKNLRLVARTRCNLLFAPA